MRNFRITWMAIAIASIFCSCASSYKAVHPSSLNYAATGDNHDFSYKYDVLLKAKNKKYAKKEAKFDLRVVAIRIINNTGHTLKYGHNYKIYSGGQEVRLLSGSETVKSIKQTVPTYLLYLLLTPMRFTITTETSQSSTPIGYVLGPGLAILNVAIATSANSNFKKELDAHDILEKEIKDGETVYGLVAIQSADYMPLSIKLTDNSQ